MKECRNQVTMIVLLMIVGIIFVGCSVNPNVRLGPEETHQITFVHPTTKAERVIETALVVEHVKARLWMTEFDEDGKAIPGGKVWEDVKDLWDCQVTRPDIAVAKGLIGPRVSQEIMVKILREDGKTDYQNIGGWVVGFPAPKRPSDPLENGVPLPDNK